MHFGLRSRRHPSERVRKCQTRKCQTLSVGHFVLDTSGGVFHASLLERSSVFVIARSAKRDVAIPGLLRSPRLPRNDREEHHSRRDVRLTVHSSRSERFHTASAKLGHVISRCTSAREAAVRRARHRRSTHPVPRARRGARKVLTASVRTVPPPSELPHLFHNSHGGQ